MLQNLRASQKSMPLVLILVASLIIFSVLLSAILQHNTRNQIASKAETLIATTNSLRNYTIAHVRPELADRLEDEFLPEVIPNFAAREVFEDFRQQPNYRNFFYKDATINPFNPRDRADEFEIKIIEKLRKNAKIPELSGFRPSPQGDLFYLAYPIQVSQPSCLECHGEPSAAPSSLVERYGSSDGFKWKLNQIVGAQIVSVPVNHFARETRHLFLMIIGAVVISSLPLLLIRSKLAPIHQKKAALKERRQTTGRGAPPSQKGRR